MRTVSGTEPLIGPGQRRLEFLRVGEEMIHSATVLAAALCLVTSQAEARSGGERATHDDSLITVKMQLDVNCTGRNCKKREFGAGIADVDGDLTPAEADKLGLTGCSGRNCSQRE